MSDFEERVNVCYQALHDATCTLPVHTDACRMHGPTIRDAIRLMLWRLDEHDGQAS